MINKLLDQRFGRETVTECVDALDDWRRTWRDGVSRMNRNRAKDEPADGEVVAGLVSLGPTGEVAYGAHRVWLWKCGCGEVFGRILGNVRRSESMGCRAGCRKCKETNRLKTRRSNYWKHRHGVREG